MVPSESAAVAAIGTVAGAVKFCPAFGEVSETVGGLLVCSSPQVVPLMANEVGAGLLPVQVPLKPMLVLAPVARLPFHGMFWAVTRVPDWLQVALQPCS